MAKKSGRQAKPKPPEEEYLSCENATSLWALVYSTTRFNRRVVTAAERKKCT